LGWVQGHQVIGKKGNVDMPVSNRLRGVFAYPLTPTKNDGKEIDGIRLQSMLDFLISNRVHGITVLGSTGSIGSFNEDESKEIAEIAVKHVDGRVPIYIGTGSMSTDETIRRSEHAERVGASGIQLVAMAHWPLTEDELYDYYRDVASAVSLPILVHNGPALSGMDLKPPLLIRLAKIDNIRHFKEGSGDLARMSRLRQITGGKIELWYDQDATALQGLFAGADVWTPVVSALIPSDCVKLFELAVENHDVAKARQLFDRMFPLIDFVATKGAVRVLHSAFEMMGQPAGSPRRPLKSLEPTDQETLRKLLVNYGLLAN
jgi:4-hydroxy-tetrahydrodipicolinate synthase